MTIQPVGSSVFVLFFPLDELEKQGLQPEHLTEEDTLALVRQGLALSKYSADRPLEVESYPDRSGLLLFVHTPPSTKTVWRFWDSDALLDALPIAQGCSMFWWKDSFWLVSDNADTMLLSEFADLVADDPFLSARLEEYALPIRL